MAKSIYHNLYHYVPGPQLALHMMWLSIELGETESLVQFLYVYCAWGSLVSEIYGFIKSSSKFSSNLEVFQLFFLPFPSSISFSYPLSSVGDSSYTNILGHMAPQCHVIIILKAFFSVYFIWDSFWDYVFKFTSLLPHLMFH